MPVFGGVAGVVLAGAGTVTVGDGAVTVFAGAVTVVVSAGFGDCTLTPRLLVVETVCWLTVVGVLDLLSEAITPASTPSAASRANTGHIQPPRPLAGGSWGCSPWLGSDPDEGLPPSGSGDEPGGGGETDTRSSYARVRCGASSPEGDRETEGAHPAAYPVRTECAEQAPNGEYARTPVVRRSRGPGRSHALAFLAGPPHLSLVAV